MGSIGAFFAALWKYWKRFGDFLGDVVGRLVMMIMYWTVIVPFALLTRLSSDPLDVKDKKKQPAWVGRHEEDTTMKAALEQSISH
jgi:hypothetical protein